MLKIYLFNLPSSNRDGISLLTIKLINNPTNEIMLIISLNIDTHPTFQANFVNQIARVPLFLSFYCVFVLLFPIHIQPHLNCNYIFQFALFTFKIYTYYSLNILLKISSPYLLYNFAAISQQYSSSLCDITTMFIITIITILVQVLSRNSRLVPKAQAKKRAGHRQAFTRN